MLRFPKIVFPEMFQVFPDVFEVNWCIQKLSIISCGRHGHVHQIPKKHKMMTVGFFGKWILKVTSPQWSRIILRSFWANLLMKFVTKIAPRTLPDPESGFCPGSSMGNQPLFEKRRSVEGPQGSYESFGRPGCQQFLPHCPEHSGAGKRLISNRKSGKT